MRATLVTAVVGVTFAVLGALNEVADANLVVNGGFETGTFTGSWSEVETAPPNSADPTTSFAHTGTYSADISNPHPSDFDLIYQDLATVMGQSYSLTFWVFNTGSGNDVDSDDSLEVIWAAAPSLTTAFSLTPVSTTLNTWVEVTVSPLTATSTLTRLGFQGYDNSGNFLIDDICLVVVPEASAFVAVGLVGALGVAAVKLRRRLRRGQ